MARTSDKKYREAARRTFLAEFDRSGNYRSAARVAGVSERTGRRWRAEVARQSPAAGVRASWSRAPTSFEGRTQELADIDARFARGARLLTVLGPPGIGKTRLAAQWMESNGAKTIGPATFCDLRGAVTEDALFTELGRRIDLVLSDTGAASPVEVLGRVLAARGPCVVVLDNVEELGEAALRAVSSWMASAPEARLVATSRRVLRLSGEQILEVGPLVLPSDASADTAWTEAMQLFERRAHAVEPSLSRSGLPAGVVAQIVRRLDGIPLAIELAAAQMRSVSPARLLGALQAETLSLANPALDADPRHATLRTAIESGFQQLSSGEKDALMYSSVFRGGFTSEALAAVVGSRHEPSGIANGLAGLRETSFLRSSREDSHERRWDVYEAIREYAYARLLATGEAERAALGHAQFFLEWGEGWVRRLPTADGSLARRRLLVELGNLRAAFDAFEQAGDECPTELLRLATVLHEALAPRFPRGALDIADRAVIAAGNRGADVARMRVLIGRASAARETDRQSEAEDDLDLALQVINERLASGDLQPDEGAELGMEVHLEKGMLHYFRGEVEQARDHLERAVADAQRHRLHHAEARARIAVAWVLAEAYRDSAAFEHYPRAVSLMREAGDVLGELFARSVWLTHRLFFEHGDVGPDLEQLVDDVQRLGAPYDEAQARVALSVYRREQGQLEEAEDHAVRICEIAERVGLTRLRGVGATVLGMAVDERGHVDRASVAYEEAAAIFRTIRDLRYEALVEVFLGGIAAREGRVDRADQLLSHAEALLDQSGDQRFVELVAIQRGQVDLAWARRAIAAGDLPQALALRRRAKERVATARQPPQRASTVTLPLARCCIEARHLIRILEGTLGPDEDGPWSLKVSPDGSYFSLGDDPAYRSVDGPVIRRVLLVLVAQRLKAPGEPLAPTELLALCWPGERMQRDAGFRRVRDLVKRLRRIGLEGLLVTREGGYLLEPDVPVAWLSAAGDSTAPSDP